MRPWASRAAQESFQLLHNRFRGCLIESPGAALDPRRLDAGDLCGAHDGWRGQAGTREVGDRHIARPRRIVGAGDHRHPNQSKGCEPAVGNDQRRTAFFSETVGIRKRHHDDVEGVEAALMLPTPVQGWGGGGSPAQRALPLCGR